MRLSVFAATCALALSGGAASPARAFDFFGLFGTPEEAKVTPDAVAYQMTLSGLGEDAELEQNLKQASKMWRLRLDAPPSGFGLTRRAISDFQNIADALWASGYFDAGVRLTIAGIAVAPDGAGAADAARAADAMRGRALAPVRYDITPGPLYKLRNVIAYDARTKAPIGPGLIDRSKPGADPTGPARASAVRAVQAAWIDQLRAQSYPLAKVVDMRPVVEHGLKVMDVAVTIDPGPRAGIGEVELKGSPGVDPEVIRSFIYLEPGEPYSPKRLADTRKSIAEIEAIGGVKIEDGDHLDAQGNLPIFVTTSARKLHAVALSAQFSSVDGPSARASWTHRNLFGGGERLRLSVEGGLASFGGSSTFHGLSKIGWRDVIGKAGASFVKPALWGSRNDLLVDVYGVRESTDYYYASYANANVAIRHRFSEYLSAQAGIEAEGGRSVDLWGGHDYSLLGVPLAVAYDSTDSKLEPTRGVRVNARVTPYAKALPHGIGMVQSKAQASAYHAFDDDARFILAGRVAAGSTIGTSIANLPANRRFFVGGGGSVRGYSYRSLSPTNGFDYPTGGLSFLEASLEARIKITQSIGVVPFFDAGMAFASPYPDFRTPLRESVGLGLRYFTPIGPLRIDFAVPLARKANEKKFGVLIGVGEAF